MSLKSVLVTDTNIWIDLYHGGILAEVFQLPYQFLIPDFAVQELRQPTWESLEILGLQAHELNALQIVQLSQLRQTYRNLSIVDLAAYLLAKLLDATLVTGDRHLNGLAVSSGLSVHGQLWLLDEMLRFQVVLPEQAVSALIHMRDQGARLPKQETELRIMNWSQGPKV